MESRTSHEVRGLKFRDSVVIAALVKSHLTRGAWIEMYSIFTKAGTSISRTSHEVRGLKYKGFFRLNQYFASHLTRGAWIEI